MPHSTPTRLPLLSRAGLLALSLALIALFSQNGRAFPIVTNVVETGGDNEASDTIIAKWTGVTYPATIANEPVLGIAVGTPYTVPPFGNYVPCYVDRAHRYTNASATVPIPAYLLGQEYIMSGNDNRDNASYRLDVSVTTAVQVYLLIDNRLGDAANGTPPTFDATHMQWVLDENWVPVKTGANRSGNPALPDEVGIDEGANDTIDNWFSVYTKQFPPCTFTLRQADNTGQNMYGAVIAPAVLTNVFAAGDPITLVNGVNDGDANAGPPPGAEGVEHSIDRVTQKYLNFLDLGSGFATTPSLGATIAQKIRFYTANDAEERDPASYVLEGSTTGINGPWTTIASGPLSLPSGRNPGGQVAIDPATQFNQLVEFSNCAQYSSYRVTFPTLKNAAAANSMQIGEVELLGLIAVRGPSFVTQPADQTVRQGLEATFTVVADGTAPLAYQWFRKLASEASFSPIAGANSASYTTPPTGYPADDNSLFKVEVSNSAGTRASREATLHVTQDPTPPTLVSATGSADFLHATILFSEEVQALGAQDPFNYSIDGGLGVVSAVLSADRRSVTLGTAIAQTPDTAYTITVNNVADLANNTIAIDSMVTFRSWAVGACAGVVFETYNVGGGTAVANLTNNALFPNSPDFRTVLPALDIRTATVPGPGDPSNPTFYNTDARENYGGRMRGYFIASESGPHTFFFSSDDNGELWLSTDHHPSNKALIARESAWSNTKQWTVSGGGSILGEGGKRSAPITLQAGHAYYIEALYKEGGGGDNCAVAVQLPSQAQAMPPVLPMEGADAISGAPLGSIAPAGILGNVTVSQQPASQTVFANSLVTFTVGVSAPTFDGFTVPVCYQWSRDGVDIPGATGPSYTLGPVNAGDDGARFVARAAVIGSQTTSAQAILHVVSDVIPPSCVSATASLTLSNIVVVFSEFMDTNNAMDNFNYTVAGFSVTRASLNPDGKSVTLELDAQLSPNSTYQVNIQAVADLAGNVINPNPCSLSFRTPVVSCGFLVFQAYRPESTSDNSLDNTLLADPNFPSRPNEVLYMTAFDTRTVYPNDSHEGYGALMFGYFIPPTSGNWIFYLRSDDSSRLFLNTNGANAGGKALITEETGCCNPFSAHASQPQPLIAGQQYYIEALLKEGTGGDYCQVAAKLDTDPTNPDALAPISGAYLAAPANPVGAAVNITQQPSDVTFIVGSGQVSATFSVGVSVMAGGSNNPPTFYQWYRNNGSGFVAIPGANGTNFSFAPACGDNGVRFRVQIYVPGAAATSQEATLTVTSPNTPPIFALTPPPAGTQGSGAQSVPGTAHDIAPGTVMTGGGSRLNIGLNFGADEVNGSGSGTLTATTQAGAVPQKNWNNLRGASGAAGGLVADGGGTPVATVASVTWTSPNTWSSTGRGEENNGFPMGSGDRTLMTGYLDTSDQASGAATVTVSGLGTEFTASGYDVIVYALGGVAGRGGAYTIGGTTKFGTAPANPASHVEDAGAGLGDTGTYVRFNGLSGSSFTLVADASVQPGSNLRAPINGIQILAHQSGPVPFLSYCTSFDALPAGSAGTGTTPPFVDAGHLVLSRSGVGSEANYWTLPLGTLPTVPAFQASWKSLLNGVGGADGYSFNIGQNVGTGFTPEEGGSSGLSVTVDTFDNGGGEVGIETRWNGSRLSFLAIGGGTVNGPAALEKNQFVDAAVTVSASGQVTFNYDGYVTMGQIPSYTGLNANQVVFAARTGGASEDAFIDDLCLAGFAPPTACDSESGQTVQFSLSNSNPGLFSAQPAISPDGTLTYAPAPGACGTATISVVAMDNGGTAFGGDDTSDPQTFVLDIRCLPTLNCPPGVVAECTGGLTPVTYNVTAIDSSAAPLPVTCVPPSGTGFRLGVSNVVCTATDSRGLSASCTFQVTVVDTTPPRVTCPGNITTNTFGPVVILYIASASDTCGIGSFDCTPPSGSTFPCGTTPVTCVGTDASGNTDICRFTVTVNCESNRCPTAVAKASPNVQLTPNQTSTIVIAGNNSNACVTLDGSMSTDPDNDTLTYVWLSDLDGDGTKEPFASRATVNYCFDLGVHDIMLVVDDGHCARTASITVEVLTPGEAIEALIDKVNNADLGRRNKRPLIATLKAAVASFDRGSCVSGVNQLEAFQNKVRAQIGSEDPALADEIIALAQEILDAIDCGSSGAP